ncbi:MAG: hypothetical protein JRF37_00190 [Deltaproteobacteria bacterium]|nr:hypothetical protein [Deltaproteobacteria bacterium]
MSYSQPFDHMSIWVVFIITAAFFFSASEFGFRVGRFKHRRLAKGQTPNIGTILGAALGLLAFFLAFTFGMAGSRNDARKQLILDEVNSIETTYLRATLLPAPYSTEFQDLLRQYINTRAEIQTATMDSIQQIIDKSEELHRLLWSKVVTLTENNNVSGVTVLFIRSLNEILNMHGKRLNAGLFNRIPVSIFLTLYFVAFLSMTLIGYQAGLTGKRSPIASFALILTFATVLILIIDLERPEQKIFSVSQQAMVNLKDKINPSP